MPRLLTYKLTQGFGIHAVNPQIDSLTGTMLAIDYTALVGVMLGAAQTRDNVCWLFEMFPCSIGNTYNGFAHFSRIAIAVFAAALATEFLALEILDGVPPSSSW